MHEVQKHLTISDHGYIGYAVIVNKKFWDGLPPDVRGQLEGAMKEATKYSNDIAQKENDEAMEGIRKAGKTTIYTLTTAEKAQWKAALAPVSKAMAVRLGKETIAAIEQAAAAPAAPASAAAPSAAPAPTAPAAAPATPTPVR